MKKTDTELVEQAREYFEEAEEGLAEEMERAKESFRFYIGEQWDPAVASQLDQEGRPHLTFNRMLPTINVISGYQRKFRNDLAVLPRRGGDQKVAAVLTELAKHASDQSNAEYAHSEWFMQGIVGNTSWLEYDIDRSYDPEGDLVIRAVSPWDVFYDPLGRNYNANDHQDGCRYLIQQKWFEESDMELHWPNAKKVLQGTEGELIRGEDYRDVLRSGGDDYGDARAYGSQKHKARRKQYRVKYCWWKDKKRETLVISPTGQRIPWRNDRKKMLGEALGHFPGFRVIERVVPVLHCTIHVGDILLENIDDPFEGRCFFPLVRFCPFWVDGYAMGLLDNLKDPQRELNKRRSQMLHHLNQSANSGWLVDLDGLSDTEQQKLQDFGARPGVMIGYRGGKDKRPERIEPARLSDGHLILAREAEDDIKKSSGANADMLGYAPERRESGRAMDIRKEQGLVIGEVVFDNFNYAQQLANEILVELIRYRRADGGGLYSDQEIAQIVQEKNLDVDMNALRDMATGRYRIKVAESENNPTIRSKNFYAMLEAVKAGLPIPPQVLIEMSDLPNRDEVMAVVAQQQQQQMEMAQQQQQIQIMSQMAKVQPQKPPPAKTKE